MENTATQPASGRPNFGSAFDLFKPSIRAVKVNFWTIVCTYLIVVIPMGVLTIVAALSSGSQSDSASANAGTFFVSTLMTIVIIILSLAVYPAVTYATLQGAKGQHITIGEAFRVGFHFIWRFLGLVILLGLMIFGSLLLFIVPFFFVLPRVILAPYYLIDRDLGPVQAIKQCMNDYKLYRGTWGVIGVSFLLELPSAVPIVGWLVSVVLEIMYLCALPLRYLQIKDASNPRPGGGVSVQPAVAGASVAQTPPANPLPPTPPSDPQQPTTPPAPQRPLVQ